ncbi:MAG: tetratricopeptide repeat protein [Cyanobacteriota bacterium ELA615]
MSKYRWVFSLLLGMGICSVVKPVMAQALLPYTPEVKADQFEEKGIDLAQQVQYLLRFRLEDSATVSSATSMALLATQLAPNRFETWRILALLYAQQKEYDKSLVALEKAISLEPKNAENYFLLGRIYFQKADYPSAQTNLEKGLHIKPDFVEALFDLGNTKFKLGKLPEAVDAYQKAVTVDKKFWPAMNNIGLVRYEQGNIAGAIKIWQEVIALDNQQAEPKLALAVALYQQRQKENAYAKAKDAFSLDPQYSDLNFLKENLWGKTILHDTEILIGTPDIQNVLKSLNSKTKTTTSP